MIGKLGLGVVTQETIANNAAPFWHPTILGHFPNFILKVLPLVSTEKENDVNIDKGDNIAILSTLTCSGYL